MPLPLGEVSPKVTERALPLPCGELPPQRLRGLEIGEARKMLLAKRLAFFRFDLCFGIIKGEQPLIRGSSASKSLALFWFSFGAKREQTPPGCSASKSPCPCRAKHAAFASQTGLGLSCPPGTAVLSGSLLVPKENNPRPAAAHRNRCGLAALNTRHLLRKPVCGLKAPLGLSCPPGTAVLSGSLLVPKENKLRPVKLFRIIQKLLFISCFSASTVRGESTRGCCGRPSGRRTARRSPC